MGLLQQIAVKALKFSRSRTGRLSPHFDELKNLVSQVTLVDCHYDAATSLFPRFGIYEFDGNPPCLYTSIYENEFLHLSIFGLRSHGEIPLHDHPNIHGFIKVLCGRVQISSFSKTDAVRLPHEIPLKTLFKQRLASWQEKSVFPVIVCPDKVADHNSEAMVLTPIEENIHLVKPLDGNDAVFFDLLTPPYFPPERDCHYYMLLDPLPSTQLPTTLGSEKIAWVTRVPPPKSYFCEEVDYFGEKIDLDDLIYAS